MSTTEASELCWLMLAWTQLWLAINKEYSRILKGRKLNVHGGVGRGLFYAAYLAIPQAQSPEGPRTLLSKPVRLLSVWCSLVP